MNKRALMMAIALSGCVPLQPRLLGTTRTLAVTPTLHQQTQAIVNPNTLSSIATLDIVPYVETTTGVFEPISATTGATTSPGALDMLTLSQASPTIDPNRPIVIRRLKPNKKYRVYGKAYNQNSQLISANASSYVEVTLGSDDAPAMAALPVNLIATPFAASTTVQVTTNGNYDYLKSTLYQVSGNTQVAIAQTVRKNPELAFNNLQGITNYRLTLEAYKLGVIQASKSLDINVANDTTPATYSTTLDIPWIVSTLAGSTQGSADGNGTAAQFYAPSSIAFDPSGNLIIADSANHLIRKMTPSGTVTTLAGLAGNPGSTDGTGNAARFYNPNITTDDQGNIYAVDYATHIVRKVTAAGVVTTIAGLAGSAGGTDGTGNVARFDRPVEITMGIDGYLYIADLGNNTIRKLSTAGVVTTLAGLAGNAGSTDGTGAAARFNGPHGVAVDKDGNVYVSDNGNSIIRKVTPAGVVSTLAGLAGNQGCVDGTGNAARFKNPGGMSIGTDGNLYLADHWNHVIRRITPGGVVTTLAGSPGVQGYANGTGAAAQFSIPQYAASAPDGTIYVPDQNNNRIRVVR